jgi:hypothetical protein
MKVLSPRLGLSYGALRVIAGSRCPHRQKQ